MKSPAQRAARAERWQRRVMLVGGCVLGGFLLLMSLWGGVLTWRVAMAFRTGGTVVQWQDGPDLVVMAAPLLAVAASLAWPGAGIRHPLLSCLAFLLLILLIGTGLGKGDAWLLGRVASAHGYRYCPALDVWDAHGGRGGGPALQSWGYTRGVCPVSAGG